jgi:ornithine cyclodeaminase
MEDFSALRYVHDLAQALHLGANIPLIPALADPKDLYQLIRPTAAPARQPNTATTPVQVAMEAVA